MSRSYRFTRTSRPAATTTRAFPSAGGSEGSGTLLGSACTRTPGSRIVRRYAAASASVTVVSASSRGYA